MTHIAQVKEIISEDPIKQIWKLLHYFHDIQYTSKQIKRVHGITDGTQDKNIEKQAQNISYCLKQAEDYFKASTVVGLSTRPTLLYYGVVNLSQALVLLRQNGDYSFDVLRKNDKQYSNHGLELVKEIKAIKPSQPIQFFEYLKCKIKTNENGPIGQFAIFYKSLVPPAICIHQSIHDSDKSTYIENNIAHPAVDIIPIENLTAKDISIFEAIKGLPDLYSDLLDINVQPLLTRGNNKRTVINHYKKDESTGENKKDKVTFTDDFLVDGMPKDKKQVFLDFYKNKIPTMTTVADFGSNLHFQLIKDMVIDGVVQQDNFLGYYPDIIESINGKKFYVLDPENYIPEPASYFAITYCLGMLSRYYPDIWIKTIKDQPSVAEITDTILNAVYRKFPNLILDQMTSIKHNVHL